MKSAWINYLKIAQKPGKIPELDGFRALAILLVVFHHFATYYREHHNSYFKKAIPEEAQQFMLNGWMGVDLFFVLSGYLIFHHLSTSYQAKNRIGFGKYALKRVLRTFPLYLFMIVLIVFGLIPYYQSSFTNMDILIHVVFLQDYLGAKLLTPMWSLATEEKFYLLAPLLLFLTRWDIKKSVGVLLILIMVLTAYKSYSMSHYAEALNAISFFENFRAPFHYAITSIMIGVMIALLTQQQRPNILPLLFWVSAVIILALMTFMALYHANNWHWLNGLHLLMVLMFGLMIWTAVKYSGAIWMKFLTGRFLRIISVLSYSWYLAHYTVLPWVYRLHKQHIYSEEPWIHATSFLGIYLGLSISFSLLLHYMIEKPFLIWKDRI